MVRVLDFQGTYWMRNAIPVPAPLLLDRSAILRVFVEEVPFHNRTGRDSCGHRSVGIRVLHHGYPLLMPVADMLETIF